jgi:hypothetical protein
MLKKIICLAVTSVLFSSTGTALAAAPADLAFRYAPVHYQDTDSSDYPSEYITAFDYDGDRDASNNWDNRGSAHWPATVYYSVVETCTHYYITYAFYHPRDWTDTAFDQEHENDLEGALMAVRKSGSTYGALEGMITVFHKDFFSYTPAGSPFRSGAESIDGTLSFEAHNGINRVKTAQEAKGHGFKAWPFIGNFTGASNQDGVVYYPTLGAPEYPTSGNDRYVPYRLVDMLAPNGLYTAALSDAIQPANQALTFANWGTFRGNTSGDCGSGLKTCGTNSANAPWGWDDANDGGTYRGEFALDPAHLFASYFSGLGSFSQQYINNPFLAGLQRMGFSGSNAPAGFPAQLNLSTLYGKQVGACSAAN